MRFVTEPSEAFSAQPQARVGRLSLLELLVAILVPFMAEGLRLLSYPKSLHDITWMPSTSCPVTSVS